jgi:TPR repeat protein
MSAGEEKQTGLVPIETTALTKAGAKSLAARGRTDLRIREEAEEWFRMGIEFVNKQKYEDAFSCFERRIQLNPDHLPTQIMLGVLYYYGQGVAQDYALAAEWNRKAADQGDAGAQNSLGVLYKDGNGVTQDYEKAAMWYRKAADQGDAQAQSNLGILYSNGQGVTQDYMQAAAWFRKAAEQGNAVAQFNLGVLYKYGQGVAQDYAQAANWLRKAAANGDKCARDELQKHAELYGAPSGMVR